MGTIRGGQTRTEHTKGIKQLGTQRHKTKEQLEKLKKRRNRKTKTITIKKKTQSRTRPSHGHPKLQRSSEEDVGG